MHDSSSREIDQMLADIRSETRMTRRLTGRERLDDRVMQAMARVPRDAFVGPDNRAAAFVNGPLPIGYGQTISQPFIVALMTDLLAPEPDDRVLEIGTGSGYQAAILAELCREVYSVERIPALSAAAAARLRRLGLDNVQTRVGNGHLGWPEQAPFDRIMVTAAAPRMPEALLQQLKPGGRLVIPIGDVGLPQTLVLVRKDPRGEVKVDEVLGVAFVPLVEGDADPGA